MWQLTSIRSQMVGYANRPSHCSIVVFIGPPFPSFLCFSPSIYFCSDFLHQSQAPLFFSSFQRVKERFTECEIYSGVRDMVGLRVLLEGQKGSNSSATSVGGVGNRFPQVINKANMVINKNTKPFSQSHSALPYCPRVYNNSPYLPPNPNFLDKCFLCKQKLLLGKDIYMYKGDKGFCSVECRYNQIMMDEEEIVRNEMRCSMVAMTPSSASSSTSSASSSRGSNRYKGGFAY